MTSGQIPILDVRIQRFPIAGSFTISRGAKTEAVTVVAEISRGGHTGRGECVPYSRYNETPEATLKVLQAMRERISQGLDRAGLQSAMPAGAARNALDCALLDLEAKAAGKRAWELLGGPAPKPCVTAYTISLGSRGARPRPRKPRTGRSSRSSSVATAMASGSRRCAARRRNPS